MNKMRMYVVVVAIAAGAVLLTNTFAQVSDKAPTETRIAVCDIVQVFNGYEKIATLNDSMKQRMADSERQFAQRKEHISELEETLTALEPGSPVYEKQFEEYQKKTIDLRTWQEFQKASIAREHYRLTTKIYDEIREMVAMVAAEQGYQLVLDRDDRPMRGADSREFIAMLQTRKLLYYASEIDITEEVILRVNRDFNKKP